MSATRVIAARARQGLGRFFRRCAAPFGLVALRLAMRRGFPVQLEVPVRYLFTRELSAWTRDVRFLIERRRRAIADRPERYVFEYLSTPQGPARWPVEQSAAASGPTLSGRWLAYTACVPARWGVFLHLCAQELEAATILELGTSVGISAAYLASGGSCRRLITLEGSPALAQLARGTLAEVTDVAEVVVGPFDDGLTQAFATLDGSSLDLAYVDGHHDEAATLHYAGRLFPHLRPGALVIFDDIYLYEEMWRAWCQLRAQPGVSAAVNVGRFGILVWAGGDARAVAFNLSRYTGWWRVRGSRARVVAQKPAV